MMRTVADALGTIKSLMDRMETGEMPLVDGGICIGNNVVEIRSAIERSVEVEDAGATFMAVLQRYTGGKSYTATIHRCAIDTKAARQVVWDALHRYRDVLRQARPNAGQLIICAVDDTQVSDPF